ncbi:hypothetical protein [Nostoc sp. CCY 9925]|uniref:hypothetical protein n=1 Tax=Nostoc sp. CCY 9925 TaxID=3103865 RepID=UPI0039C5D231
MRTPRASRLLVQRVNCCIVALIIKFTFAVSIQGCTPFQQPPVVSIAPVKDTVGAKSPTPVTANPQKSHGWPLDATAVTSHIAAASFTCVRWRNRFFRWRSSNASASRREDVPNASAFRRKGIASRTRMRL